MLTKGLGRPDCAAQRTGGEVVRRSRAALPEEGAAVELRPSDPHGSTPGDAADMIQGSGRAVVHRRRENAQAAHLTGGG